MGQYRRFIINPEADLELAEIVEYILESYHDYGWHFVEEKNQCSFMSKNLYKYTKHGEPEIFEGLKESFPPGMSVVVGIFKSGEKSTGRMIHTWVEVGPIIVDPTYKQFLKGREEKFDNMVSRYRKRRIVNPTD